MKFVRMDPNESLEALAARVAEAPDAAARERNVAALARANPHLANRPCGEGRARAYAAVPDDLEGRVPDEEPDTDLPPAEAALRRVGRRLGAALEQMPEELEAEKGRIIRERKILDRDLLDEAAADRPEIERALGCARSRSHERLERLGALDVLRVRVAARVREDLGRMSRDAADLTRELRSFADARGRPSDRDDREDRHDQEGDAKRPTDDRRPEGDRRAEAERRRRERKEREEMEAERRREAEARREKELAEERRRKEKKAERERRAAERAEGMELPTVRELPDFLAEIRDPRVVRRLKERDERKTARPIFERRLRELKEEDSVERDTEDGRDDG